MNALQLLIEHAKLESKEKTYAAVARRLNVTPQTLQQWRDGSIPISDDRISQLAHAAKMPAEFWLPKIYGEQAKTASGQKNWARVAEIVRLSMSGAALLVLFLLPGLPAAAAQVTTASKGAPYVHYAKFCRCCATLDVTYPAYVIQPRNVSAA